MSRLTVSIVEDEQGGRDYIRGLLQDEFPQLKLLSEAASMEAALRELGHARPDILLLDIDLGDGTGFDLLSRFEAGAFQTIFITASHQHAIRAIRAHAVDYLLKPILSAEFTAAMHSAIAGATAARVQAVAAPKISIPTARGLLSIDIRQIVRCEADSNYTHLFLTNHSRHIIARTLQEYEALLQPHGFYRVHHKHLINLQQLKEYTDACGGNALLADGTLIPVSVRRRSSFLKHIRSRLY